MLSKSKNTKKYNVFFPTPQLAGLGFADFSPDGLAEGGALGGGTADHKGETATIMFEEPKQLAYDSV